MSGKLKEVRERIKSVQSTQQITKAMKMVSAAKLRRAQQAIVEMRPYANRLDKMMKNIVANLEGDIESPFVEKRDVQNVAMIIITSSRGLCGAFNTNIIKEAIAKIENDYSKQKQNRAITLIFVGKKGYDVLRKRYAELEIVHDFVGLFADLSYENISRVSEYAMSGFSGKRFDIVDVCFGQFKNAAVQEPKCVPFLPVVPQKVSEDKTQEKKSDYIFEPSKQSLLAELIPSMLQINLQKYVLENHASEHGARMTAMDNATTNADELMKELKINYNKARQEAITKELSEIVGGAAALNG